MARVLRLALITVPTSQLDGPKKEFRKTATPKSDETGPLGERGLGRAGGSKEKPLGKAERAQVSEERDGGCDAGQSTGKQ